MVDCPTRGGSLITVTGRDFPPMDTLRQVLVGSKVCEDPEEVSSLQPSTGNQQGLISISCTLPPGTGKGREVLVQFSTVVSEPVPLVSYANPKLTTITGCDDSSTHADVHKKEVVNCDRTGNSSLTISGTDFGNQGAQVLVGGRTCGLVKHVPPAQSGVMDTVTCILPPGQLVMS